MASWLELPGERGGRPGAHMETGEEIRRRRPGDELMRSGERLFYEGEFQAAAREFRGARKHDPLLFEAWAAEVEARLRAGDLPRAEETAEEALAAYGKVPIFYAAKALVLAHQGYIEAACEHSDIAVKLHDDSGFTWLARAEVVLATGAWGTAHSVEACLERACRADPTHWRANFRAGLALAQWGSHERALQRLAQVTQFVPQNPFVWKTMGDCHRALGHAAAARECYHMALARRPGYAPAVEALEEMTLWGRLRAWAAGLLRRKSAARKP